MRTSLDVVIIPQVATPAVQPFLRKGEIIKTTPFEMVFIIRDNTMLKGKLIHPEIMAALSMCGHGDKVLIADGNYPLASKTGEARNVYLGLAPGLPTVDSVLEIIQTAVNIEKVQVMESPDGSTPEIFLIFKKMIGELELEKLERYSFYDACSQPDVRLAISTGEQRVFANILITIGVA